MNFYTAQSDNILRPALSDYLQVLRAADNFDATNCIAQKSNILSKYFLSSGLKTAVIGVSGGIDSAVVLGLAVNAMQKLKVIERIIPILLPVFSPSATGQDSATARGVEWCTALGLKPNIVALTEDHQNLAKTISNTLNIEANDWANGQLVSYLRTPALYFVTSLCSQQNMPGVIVGTTNRDEGSYLGYFGKASDGLVDIQLISDLHKSELYAMARSLGVSQSILDATPTGDMYDGRTDEEVFGVSYEFVELFLRMKSGLSMPDSWSIEDQLQYISLSKRLEQLHTYNAHKYTVGSPAIHLDVLNRDPLAWKYNNFR